MRILSLLALSLSLYAQGPMAPPPEQIAAMNKLSFLLGEWRGEAWTMVGSQKHTSTGTEVVQSKLNGTIVTIDGTFKDAAGKTIHNAFGVFSFNPRSDLYRFHAYAATGQMVEAKVAMRDNGLNWSFEPAPGVQISYSTQLDEKGEWVEKGEMTREGKTTQFFEMRLRKIK